MGQTEVKYMEYTIRNVRPEDAEQVAEIESLGFPAAEAASAEELKKRIDIFPESFFVAEADGRLLGFVDGACADEIALPDSAYHDLSLHRPEGICQQIFGLNVRREYRRQGIGAALMRHMIRSAYIRGKKAVILTCKADKIPLYTSVGYRMAGLSDSTHGGASWFEMRYEFRPYTHTVQYYETDKMGCVHHSNYIRWFEEARTDFLQRIGLGYDKMEAEGVMSPLLDVSAAYKTMTRYGDTVDIEIAVEYYNGIKFGIVYRVLDHASGELRCTGKTHHCFLNTEGKLLSLKKAKPAWHEILSACAVTHAAWEE